MRMLILLNLLFSLTMLLSESPLMTWMMMEMGNITFIMLFSLMQYVNTNTCAMMVMVQFFSSTLVLAGILQTSNILLSLGILVKLGMYPGHIWMPLIMFLSPWKLNLLTMILPKIPPFLMMSHLTSMWLMFFSVAITSVISSLKLILTSDNKIIMALSSMIHSSWMVTAMAVSNKCWAIYFALYTVNTFMACFVMAKNYHSPYTPTNKTTKILLIMIVFSMVGLPPITMFLGKLYLIKSVSFATMPMMIVLIISSSISILYYSRIFLKKLFMSEKTPKTSIKSNYLKIMSISWLIFMMIMIMML